MSGSKEFHWDSGIPDDCNASEFNIALKAYGWADSKDTDIYSSLKGNPEVSSGKWLITVSSDYVIAQDLPGKVKQILIAEKEQSPQKLQSAGRLFSANSNDYRFQLKFTEKKGQQVLYSIKNPLAGNDKFIWDTKLEEIFANSMPLSVLISLLQKNMLCKFKPEHLDSIDIGTTDIKIYRDDPGSPFRLESISQQQAPSTRAEREKTLANEKENLETELKTASDKLQNLEEERKQIVEQKSLIAKQNNEIVSLKQTIQSYEKMIQDFTGVKSVGQHTMKDEAAKKVLFRKLVPELKKYYRDDLKPILKVNIESIEDLMKSLESITERKVSDLSHEDLALIMGDDGTFTADYMTTEPIQDLERQLKKISADSILYILGAPEQRKSDKIRAYSEMLKKFLMEPIFFEPGAKPSTGEARFIDVKQTSFERGLCVETVSFGIRNLENNSIIYKADVIISR